MVAGYGGGALIFDQVATLKRKERKSEQCRLKMFFSQNLQRTLPRFSLFIIILHVYIKSL